MTNPNIVSKWEALGGRGGILGEPIGSEGDAARGGKYCHYMGGSIYWSAQTGAHYITGHIWDKYEELSWENSGLGFPTTDPENYTGDEIRQKFEGGSIIWSPQKGVNVISEPRKKEVFLRVFLIEFEDLLHPAGYTREFFERCFFSVNQTLRDPTNIIPMQGSIYDYYYSISDGYMRITGVIDDGTARTRDGWTQVPFYASNLWHWRGGIDPSLRPKGNIPVAAVIAYVLRERKIFTLDDLRVNGRLPDCLIFYGMSLLGGGTKITIDYAIESLRRCYTEDRREAAFEREWGKMYREWKTWSSRTCISMPITYYGFPQPDILADGTVSAPSPRYPLTNLRFFGTGILIHELGHFLGEYDLGNENYQWETYSDPMSITPWDAHYPPPYSSFILERFGCLNLTEIPRRTQAPLTLYPYENHNVAYRFQNGSMNDPETIVIENRTIQELRQNPPTPLGRGLFIYRVDLKKRQAVNFLDKPQSRRLAFLVRAAEVLYGEHNVYNREYWGVQGHNDVTGTGLLTENTLNHLGECWWEFKNITHLLPPNDGIIQFDAEFQAKDLIQMYTTATWTNARGENLTPDVFHGSKGHVMFINRTEPIDDGLRYNNVLFLHPNWNPNGRVDGVYHLSIPPGGAKLYLTVALSEMASRSDGFTFRVIAHEGTGISGDHVLAEKRIYLTRNKRTFVVDLSAYRGSTMAITFEVDAGRDATQDWAYLLEAYLVPTSPIQFDFINLASSAQWRGNVGGVVFGAIKQSRGEASCTAWDTLQNGFIYGGNTLLTHPAWQNDGYIEGVYKLTLPPDRSVFRAEVGFQERRSITDNGARVSARFIQERGRRLRAIETVILHKTMLKRNPYIGEVGTQRNPLTSIAVTIPDSLRGSKGQFILRVEAAGSSAEDFVVWSMARLTQD